MTTWYWKAIFPGAPQQETEVSFDVSAASGRVVAEEVAGQLAQRYTLDWPVLIGLRGPRGQELWLVQREMRREVTEDGRLEERPAYYAFFVEDA